MTRSSSYTRKSQFQVEEEDIEKLEIRCVSGILQTAVFCAKREALNQLEGDSGLRELSSQFIGETQGDVHLNLNCLLV